MRLIIADDSLLLREGIARLVTAAGFEVIASVGTAEELLPAVAADEPDVALVDIRMPPTHTDEGLRAARELRARHPGLGILLLSQFVHAGRALDLFRSRGAGLGYLLKDRVTDVDDFLGAIRRIARGGSVLDPDVVTALMNETAPATEAPQVLTERERQVLGLMAQGRSNGAIAAQLQLARKTVEAHVGMIFAKLQLETAADDNRRVLAVLAYLQGTHRPPVDPDPSFRPPPPG